VAPALDPRAATSPLDSKLPKRTALVRAQEWTREVGVVNAPWLPAAAALDLTGAAGSLPLELFYHERAGHNLYQSAEGIFVTVNRSYKLVPAPIRRIPNEWFGRCHIHFKESCVSDTILEKPLGRSTIIDKSSQTGWASDYLPRACCGSSVVGVGGTQCLLVRTCMPDKRDRP
jgi:hypothetical protein